MLVIFLVAMLAPSHQQAIRHKMSTLNRVQKPETLSTRMSCLLCLSEDIRTRVQDGRPPDSKIQAGLGLHPHHHLHLNVMNV